MKVLFLLIMLVLFPIKTNAAYEVIDVRCTNEVKKKIREDGQDVVYRLSKVKVDENVTYTAYFYNVSDSIYLKDSNNTIYTNLKIENLKPGSRISVNVYASNKTYCEGYKSSTIIINVPYYNPYFDSELCSGYENYSLCKEHVSVTLTKEEFIEKLNKYKKSLEKEEEEIVEEPIIEDENNIIDFMLEYRYTILIIITLIVSTIIIIKLVINEKKRGIL